MKAHPGWAVAITFLGALVVGMLCGVGIMTLVCRRRMRRARLQSQADYDSALTPPFNSCVFNSTRASRAM